MGEFQPFVFTYLGKLHHHSPSISQWLNIEINVRNIKLKSKTIFGSNVCVFFQSKINSAMLLNLYNVNVFTKLSFFVFMLD